MGLVILKKLKYFFKDIYIFLRFNCKTIKKIIQAAEFQ